MTYRTRQRVLKANGLYLILASLIGISAMDIPAIFLKRGPETMSLTTPSTGVGFLEAHGLALLLGVLLWQATAQPFWHKVALAVQLLLGLGHLAFREIFSLTESFSTGYVFTSFHWLFIALQMMALQSASVPLDLQFAINPKQITGETNS